MLCFSEWIGITMPDHSLLSVPSEPGMTGILYIAGWGRSGSTIIGNILDQLPGVFHGGEIWYVWEQGLLEDRLCGCGNPFSRCEVWQAVMRRYTQLRNAAPDPAILMAMHRKFARTRGLLRPLLGLNAAGSTRERSEYMNELSMLYDAIRYVTGARWIVDSSKTPIYGYWLSQLVGVQFKVMHLIRDPRATGFSWLSKKYDPGAGRVMVRNSLWKNSALWVVWNLAIEKLWRKGGGGNGYQRVYYSEFSHSPAQVINEIADFLEIPLSPGFLVSSDRKLVLQATHTISGNPVRMKQENIQIRYDDRWIHSMGRLKRMLVVMMTWPLLRRYGYPLRAGIRPRAGEVGSGDG